MQDRLEGIRAIHQQARDLLIRACRQLAPDDIAFSTSDVPSLQEWDRLKKLILVQCDVRIVCPNKPHEIIVLWPEYFRSLRRYGYPRKIEILIETLRLMTYSTESGEQNLTVTEEYYSPAEFYLRP